MLVTRIEDDKFPNTSNTLYFFVTITMNGKNCLKKAHFQAVLSGEFVIA